MAAFRRKQVAKYYVALSDRKPSKKMGSVVGDMQKGRRGSWMLARTRRNPAVTRFTSAAVVGAMEEEAGSAGAADPQQHEGGLQQAHMEQEVEQEQEGVEVGQQDGERAQRGEQQQEQQQQAQQQQRRPALRAFLLKPETGRTHQLRVAMKSLGAPVLGDEVGDSAAPPHHHCLRQTCLPACLSRCVVARPSLGRQLGPALLPMPQALLQLCAWHVSPSALDTACLPHTTSNACLCYPPGRACPQRYALKQAASQQDRGYLHCAALRFMLQGRPVQVVCLPQHGRHFLSPDVQQLFTSWFPPGIETDAGVWFPDSKLLRSEIAATGGAAAEVEAEPDWAW